MRRYYSSREELLLELAERGWSQWRAAIAEAVAQRTGLGPEDVAGVVTDTITTLPVFCDLLTHVTLTLEGDVDMERARRYKVSPHRKCAREQGLTVGRRTRQGPWGPGGRPVLRLSVPSTRRSFSDGRLNDHCRLY
ncbi:hypothetical protein OHU34_11110 [Streptomyces sp. NBC_00080]|uniref:hypothetical protein n=1 Tax=Streptomyces TaxID=1883 RepID=UPI00190FA954|nr:MULTISPECIES: hypothetical protein [Streptomyces]